MRLAPFPFSEMGIHVSEEPKKKKDNRRLSPAYLKLCLRVRYSLQELNYDKPAILQSRTKHNTTIAVLSRSSTVVTENLRLMKIQLFSCSFNFHFFSYSFRSFSSWCSLCSSCAQIPPPTTLSIVLTPLMSISLSTSAYRPIQ